MNYFLKSVAVFVFILSSSVAFAQDGYVSGTVIDNEFSEPLAFSNIHVKGTDVYTSTDFDGIYAIDLKPGIYTLVFSFAGYNTSEIANVEVKPGQGVELDITLATRSLITEANTSSSDRNNE